LILMLLAFRVTVATETSTLSYHMPTWIVVANRIV
jgi:hypothetical protein